jgi:hypothetical protein
VRIPVRLRKLEAARPRCDAPVLRFVRGEDTPVDAERCRACGGDHTLVVREVIVETAADVERVRALNERESQ